MIRPGEIQKRAAKIGARDTQIEKDYILSWVLYGVSQHEQLTDLLLFKGGTVLKKAYFEDYRLSEDLDFTLTEDSISNDNVFNWFKEVFEFILNEANIPLEIQKDHEHESGGINFYIGYIGPLGGLGQNKRLKVDITRGETLEFDPIEKSMFSIYSDLKNHVLNCYSLEEILIEKMCAIMGRSQPRDLYDFWYLLEYNGRDINFIWQAFKRKATNKGHKPNEFSKKLGTKLDQFKARWQGSMGDQIRDLPDFGRLLREVNKHLRRIDYSG